MAWLFKGSRLLVVLTLFPASVLFGRVNSSFIISLLECIMRFKFENLHCWYALVIILK